MDIKKQQKQPPDPCPYSPNRNGYDCRGCRWNGFPKDFDGCCLREHPEALEQQIIKNE